MGEVFKKGDFITMMKYRGMFAIFGGDILENSEDGEYSYSLITYFCPSEYSDDGQSIFSTNIDQTDTVCEYVLDMDNLSGWRRCTSDEKTSALKYLAEEHKLAYEEASCTVRRLRGGESLSFGAPRSNMQITGGTLFNQAQSDDSTVKHSSVIKRVIVENWEQKDPIKTMNRERRDEVLSVCESENKPRGSYYDQFMYGLHGFCDYDCWD